MESPTVSPHPYLPMHRRIFPILRLLTQMRCEIPALPNLSLPEPPRPYPALLRDPWLDGAIPRAVPPTRPPEPKKRLPPPHGAGEGRGGEGRGGEGAKPKILRSANLNPTLTKNHNPLKSLTSRTLSTVDTFQPPCPRPPNPASRKANPDPRRTPMDYSKSGNPKGARSTLSRPRPRPEGRPQIGDHPPRETKEDLLARMKAAAKAPAQKDPRRTRTPDPAVLPLPRPRLL
jgi:hypothetical protein